LAAGLGLYELLTREDEPDIICAAAARDQAGVVFEYARAFAESSPIADQLVIGRREIARPETRGVLRTISADGYVATASIRVRRSSTRRTPSRPRSSASSSRRSTPQSTSARTPTGSSSRPPATTAPRS